MKKYDVYITFVFTRHIQVEADSEEDAEDKAIAEKGHVSVCSNCSKKIESDIELQSTTIEEAKGIS